MKNHMNYQYSAVYIDCPLVEPESQAVAIVAANPTRENTVCDLGNMLPIRNMPGSSVESPVVTFGACVRTLFDNDISGVGPTVLDVIEFIELSRLLGVQHFTFYNNSTAHDLICVLHMYEKEGIVSLLDFGLELSGKQIKSYGQMASLND